MSIQDHVVAVVRFTMDRPGAVTLVDAVGTAFFIDDRGTFLTAASALAASVPGAGLGLAVRMRDAQAMATIVPVLARECADPPWDVAIGRADLATRRSFVLAGAQATSPIWESVCGYGCVALDRRSAGRPPVPVLRALRGNLMRELPAEGERAPPGFESSFTVPARMRGAPVFVLERPRARLFGICVGNGSLGELDDPASPAGEGRLAADAHGLVQDLRGLAGWRPASLEGASLREVIDG
jgi:hypothetical protein